MRSGEYRVELEGHPEGLRLSTEAFTLKRGETTVVTVRREDGHRPRAGEAVDPPDDSPVPTRDGPREADEAVVAVRPGDEGRPPARSDPEPGDVERPSDLPDAAPASPPVVMQEPPKEAGEAVASKGFAVEDRRHAVLLDADLKAYQAWLDRMRASGYRPNFVNAHDAAGGPRFAAIAVKDERRAPLGSPRGPE